MGVLTNCCTRQSIIQSSTISIYTLSEEDSLKTTEPYKNEIPVNLDINSALKFITSKEFHSLLVKNIPKHIIFKKMCGSLKNEEIISLINNIYTWIKKEEFEKIDENGKIFLNSIRENTKISLNYILKEMQNIKFSEKKEIFILQALCSISLIPQVILFLVKDKTQGPDAFNLWQNKNIINEAKVYGFQTAYFLLLVKRKYNKIQSGENIENKITIEKKEELNSFLRMSINFTNAIINS
jgi:hypothetical protein